MRVGRGKGPPTRLAISLSLSLSFEHLASFFSFPPWIGLGWLGEKYRGGAGEKVGKMTDDRSLSTWEEREKRKEKVLSISRGSVEFSPFLFLSTFFSRGFVYDSCCWHQCLSYLQKPAEWKFKTRILLYGQMDDELKSISIRFGPSRR